MQKQPNEPNRPRMAQIVLASAGMSLASYVIARSVYAFLRRFA